MTLLVDCHSHSSLSGHGHGTVKEMVQAAAEKGLAVYCQTEHWTLPAELDPHNEDSLPVSEQEGYFQDLLEARQELSVSSSMELVIGCELDWLGADYHPQLDPRIEYVLGSVHFIDNMPLDNSDVMGLWDANGVDGTWKRYFSEWLAMVQSDMPAAAFAHPDLPKVHGFRPSFDLREYYWSMATAVARKGAMIEVNTAGARKAAGEFYPAADLLKAFADAGVECTVGCDAHRPCDVGAGVERAYAAMYAAGYRKVAVPQRDGDRGYLVLEP